MSSISRLITPFVYHMYFFLPLSSYIYVLHQRSEISTYNTQAAPLLSSQLFLGPTRLISPRPAGSYTQPPPHRT